VTDTASAAGSKLLSLLLGGDPIFDVTKERAALLYNSYTDASNYERGFMRWDSNVLEVGTEAAGTGTLRDIRISGDDLYFAARDNFSFMYFQGSSIWMRLDDFAMALGNQHILWSGASATGSGDVGLLRDSANTLKVTDGSTGTGELIFIVPTTDPGIPGALWNNGGTLAISA